MVESLLNDYVKHAEFKKEISKVQKDITTLDLKMEYIDRYWRVVPFVLCFLTLVNSSMFCIEHFLL